MRAAIINSSTNKVVNVIELPDDYDPEAEDSFSVPSGYELRTNNAHEAEVGGELVNDEWEKPEPIVPEPAQPTVQNLNARIEALQELADSQLTDTLIIYDALILGGLL